MKRRLTLKSEHLTELTSAEMAAVAGAYKELQTGECFTGIYPSINWPCPTIQANCPSVQACVAIEYTVLCTTER
ncbi:MAG TPA: hypothetical protein VGX28_05645 [Frankiaceae bacterium]|jgi:hypothetical protein|nr:hypothetical protein [Frankiaceae bacterium]